MRYILLFAAVISVQSARAEVSAAEKEIAVGMTHELLDFAAHDKLDANRAKQQIAFFQKYFSFDLEAVGRNKFSALNRWDTATPGARQAFVNVASLILSQYMINHYSALLSFVRVNNKDMANKIIAEVDSKSPIAIKDVSTNNQRRIRVTPLVQSLGIDRAKSVEYVVVIKDNKIDDVIVGEIQTSEKTASGDATVKGLILKTAIGQISTNVAEVENQIRDQKIDPIIAYMRYFLSRYTTHLERYQSDSVEANLNLDTAIFN